MLHGCHPTLALPGPLPSAGNPFILLLCIGRGVAPRSGVWAGRERNSIQGFIKGAGEKKPTARQSCLNAARNANAPPRPVARTQPHSRCSAKYGRGANLRARFYSLRTRAVSRVRNGPYFPSRLGPCGASTSPESGLAVSAHAKILSREKRKMW